MKCCEHQGYEVVCPDGRIRHMPYHNEGDARCDASVNTERGHRYSPGNPPEWYDPPCPGGKHVVRPIVASPEPN